MAEKTYAPYCLHCEKEGHRTHECWSTHVVNARSNEINALSAPPPAGAQQAVASESPGFTTKYPLLNDLLQETWWLGKGPNNHDTVMVWFESLERYLESLAAPVAAEKSVISVEDSLRTRLRWSQEKVEQLEHENRELRGRITGASFDDLMGSVHASKEKAATPAPEAAPSAMADCQSCQGTGSGGMGVGCTDCLGTGVDPSRIAAPSAKEGEALLAFAPKLEGVSGPEPTLEHIIRLYYRDRIDGEDDADCYANDYLAKLRKAIKGLTPAGGDR